MKTSIIIPTLNGLELLKECLSYIRRFTYEPYELIVIDNGSTDGTTEYLRDQRITFVSFKHNQGFVTACNMGMKLATGDALLLLNNDVLVTRSWLRNLLTCLQSSPEVGMVGPTSNYVSGMQKVDPFYSSIEELMQMGDLNRPHRGSWKPTNRLIGFCLLIKRELMDRIGLLDERFSPGHYEDDDYCYRARLAGFRLLIAGDTFVYHHGSASFQKQLSNDLQQLIHVNHVKFMEKWNVDPHIYIE